jgi:hypothetical protein
MASFLVVRFRVVGCGQTDITLPAGGPFNAQMISGQPDAYGHEVPATTTSGHVTTCVGPDAVSTEPSKPGTSGTASSGTPVGLFGAVGVIVVGLLGRLAWRIRRREQHLDVAP